MNERLSGAIAIVITIVWATSFIVGILNPGYNPPPTLGPLMMLVAGGLFGKAVLGKKNGKGDD